MFTRYKGLAALSRPGWLLPLCLLGVLLPFKAYSSVMSFNLIDDTTGDAWAGSLSINDAVPVNGVSYTPDGSTHILQSLSVEIGGLSFTEADDSGYPNFPEVGFLNGALDYMDFVANVGSASLTIFFDSGVSENSWEETDLAGAVHTGYLVQGSSVPEPAMLTILGLGLIGMGFFRCRNTRN